MLMLGAVQIKQIQEAVEQLYKRPRKMAMGGSVTNQLINTSLISISVVSLYVPYIIRKNIQALFF